MAPTNKVHHVRTIALVAEMLGEDEDWLWDVANEMDQEDGLIWVYGPGDDGVMAFTDDGIENLKDLVQIHKDDPSILTEQQRALNASRKPTHDEAEPPLLSLSRVGPSKPIGYLPLYTLKDIVQVAPEKVAADAIARGLAAVLFGPEQCCIKSGAVYVYDPIALLKILQARADTLAAHQTPSDPHQFVAHIAAVWLEPDHPVYPIIAAAFGDIA